MKDTPQAIFEAALAHDCSSEAIVQSEKDGTRRELHTAAYWGGA